MFPLCIPFKLCSRLTHSYLQEAAHEHLVCRRALRDAQASAQLRRHHSLAANGQLSMEEKKRKVIRNLRRLESLGLVDSTNKYQELIDELAKVCCGTLN